MSIKKSMTLDWMAKKVVKHHKQSDRSMGLLFRLSQGLSENRMSVLFAEKIIQWA